MDSKIRRGRTIKRIMGKVSILLFVTLVLMPSTVYGQQKIRIKVEGYDPDSGYSSITLACFDLMQEHPEVEVVPFTSLKIEGGLGDIAGKLMAFAGQMAPDVIHMWFHAVRNNVEQGFLYPLNEYIGEDRDGNGLVDDDEAIWDEWKTIDPFYRKVLTVDGKIYGLPFGDYNLGLLYRVDLFRKAGLDPTRPPKTWDELFYCLQKLTNPKLEVVGAKHARGQRGFAINPTAAWEIQGWFWASGGNLVKAGKKNPQTGKIHWYPKEEVQFIDPETGESLVREPTLWETNFASQEGLEAWDFLYRMRWQPWMRHPRTGEPINLSEEQVNAGRVKDPATGEWISFKEEDVVEGVCRVVYGAEAVTTYELFNNAEVAVIFGGMGRYLANVTIDPVYVSFMPFPAGPHGKPAIHRSPNFKGLNNSLAGIGNKRKRDLAWHLLRDICMKKGRIRETINSAEQGNAKFLFPEHLKEAGIPEYIDEIPLHWREGYKEVLKYGRTEPYAGFWQVVEEHVIGHQVLGFMMSDKKFDYRQAARKAQDEANVSIIGKIPEQKMERYRGRARFIFLPFVFIIIFFGLRIFQSMQDKAKSAAVSGLSRGKSQAVSSVIIPWLILAPALLSILIWAYLPLVRGSVMAFQDYRIVGHSGWVGLDNFIEIIVTGKFWPYLFKTMKFAILALSLGFFVPIILAMLLSEVPRGKYLYRIVYYLPMLSSGLVIMFLWKLIYNPTEYGLLNQLMSFLGVERHDWLGSAATAMVCVIIPSIWAGVGAASLIYLAAMKTIPDDLYESAEIDGAGILQKIWYITLPTLKPLIIINFFGAFIGAFHSMRNILVMT